MAALAIAIGAWAILAHTDPHDRWSEVGENGWLWLAGCYQWLRASRQNFWYGGQRPISQTGQTPSANVTRSTGSASSASCDTGVCLLEPAAPQKAVLCAWPYRSKWMWGSSVWIRPPQLSEATELPAASVTEIVTAACSPALNRSVVPALIS